MSDRQHIQYLTHSQIDKTKWDDRITKASNGLIYAYSFYLDHMARNWDALILNDYEAVMPLTWNRKYGFHYLYQPFLAAQLGIFGNGLSEDLVSRFIQAIPVRYKLIEISLNSGNTLTTSPGFSIQRSNYVLDLSRSYDELYDSYKENIRRNIRKAKQIGCTVTKGFDAERVIELAIQQMRSYGEEAGDNIERFRKLYRLLHARQMAATYGILSPKNELIASCVFFFSHNRAYYILVGNHPDGRTIGASHALIDEFIKDHAGKKMLLDFEGSDIRNLAFFYSSFGAKHEVYPALKINRLPFYLKWLKK
ncbi:MAG: GNAT family N-acetyltransferase [Chitinophagaceae bacterium]|nr:GNAT family N-acetyltransferase [Chitinophagaceae bacterium]